MLPQLHHKYFGEVLPYLEIQKQQTEEDVIESIEMPNLTGMTVSDAKKVLIELGLEVEIDGGENEEVIVMDQLPKKGIQVSTGTKVTVYVQ